MTVYEQVAQLRKALREIREGSVVIDGWEGEPVNEWKARMDSWASEMTSFRALIEDWQR